MITQADIEWFCKKLSERLESVGERGDWTREQFDYLYGAMVLEGEEVAEANGANALDEILDVAIYAMFIAVNERNKSNGNI